jgi:hypothetical protein
MTHHIKQLMQSTYKPNVSARFWGPPFKFKVDLVSEAVIVLSGGLLSGCSTPGLKAYLDYNERSVSGCVVISPSIETPQGPSPSPHPSTEWELLDYGFCCVPPL